MIWLYFNWLILLFGSFISFCYQYPSALAHKKSSFVSKNRVTEETTLRIMYLIGKNFYENKPAWNIDSFSQFFKLPIDYIENITCLLLSKGLIVETGDSPHPDYIPAKDIETIKISEIINVAKGTESAKSRRMSDVITNIFDRIDKSADESLDGKTLKDIVLQSKDS